MKRAPSPKLQSSAIPRAELAALFAAAGALASGSAQAQEATVPAASSTEADIYVYEPAADEGVLVISQLPHELWVFLGEDLLPRDQLPSGIALPAGTHTLRFHWACGQDTYRSVTLAARAVVRIDASTELRSPDLVPLGGVPVSHSLPSACSIDPTRGGTQNGVVLAAIAALARARRRRPRRR